jgi:hypothetical protein
MSFILLATAVVAAASAAGAAFARRTGRRDDPRSSSPDAVPDDPNAPSPSDVILKAKPKEPERSKPLTKAVKVADDSAIFARLPLALGDVVSFDMQERWLAGALIARDGSEIVGVLFLAPEGAKLEAVAAFPSPRREIFWLSPVDAESGLEPPTSADFAGVVMRRRSRIPVTITRAGQGAPHVGESAIWAEYEASAGARAILIRGQSGVFAWSGAHCDEGDYDRLGRGEND